MSDSTCNIPEDGICPCEARAFNRWSLIMFAFIGAVLMLLIQIGHPSFEPTAFSGQRKLVYRSIQGKVESEVFDYRVVGPKARNIRFRYTAPEMKEGISFDLTPCSNWGLIEGKAYIIVLQAWEQDRSCYDAVLVMPLDQHGGFTVRPDAF